MADECEKILRWSFSDFTCRLVIIRSKIARDQLLVSNKNARVVIYGRIKI